MKIFRKEVFNVYCTHFLREMTLHSEGGGEGVRKYLFLSFRSLQYNFPLLETFTSNVSYVSNYLEFVYGFNSYNSTLR